jgi:hypothetical protein
MVFTAPPNPIALTGRQGTAVERQLPGASASKHIWAHPQTLAPAQTAPIGQSRSPQHFPKGGASLQTPSWPSAH